MVGLQATFARATATSKSRSTPQLLGFLLSPAGIAIRPTAANASADGVKLSLGLVVTHTANGGRGVRMRRCSAKTSDLT